MRHLGYYSDMPRVLDRIQRRIDSMEGRDRATAALLVLLTALGIGGYFVSKDVKQATSPTSTPVAPDADSGVPVNAPAETEESPTPVVVIEGGVNPEVFEIPQDIDALYALVGSVANKDEVPHLFAGKNAPTTGEAMLEWLLFDGNLEATNNETVKKVWAELAPIIKILTAQNVNFGLREHRNKLNFAELDMGIAPTAENIAALATAQEAFSDLVQRTEIAGRHGELVFAGRPANQDFTDLLPILDNGYNASILQVPTFEDLGKGYFAQYLGLVQLVAPHMSPDEQEMAASMLAEAALRADSLRNGPVERVSYAGENGLVDMGFRTSAREQVVCRIQMAPAAGTDRADQRPMALQDVVIGTDGSADPYTNYPRLDADVSWFAVVVANVADADLGNASLAEVVAFLSENSQVLSITSQRDLDGVPGSYEVDEDGNVVNIAGLFITDNCGPGEQKPTDETPEESPTPDFTPTPTGTPPSETPTPTPTPEDKEEEKSDPGDGTNPDGEEGELPDGGSTEEPTDEPIGSGR